MRCLFSLLLVVLITGCISQKKEVLPPPNILWISTEDISPAWGCYGDELATTPHIDTLAGQGFVFSQAFSNAPICAPARATLITGMYATSTGTQNLRSEIPIPDDLKILPELLREQGYYTSNNFKTDYNFSPEGRWDALGREAHWRNRTTENPFFSVFNFMVTHEGHANKPSPEDTEVLAKKHQSESMQVPPYFPDNPEFKKLMAHQYDLITVFDREVGKLIAQLKEDGLYENTIIFVFSDHGFGLPRYKRWLNDTGLRIPFVLHVPEKYQHFTAHLKPGNVDNNVGFVDFAPTVLKLADIAIPETMEGTPFLGSETKPKDYVFGYRDRADDVFDVSRSVFDGRYLYVRNFLPQRPYIQNALIFNEGGWSYSELFKAKKLGQLSETSLKMFQPKPPLELYDLLQDPYELHNLAEDPKYQVTMDSLAAVLEKHIIETKDTGFMAEGQMMATAHNSSVYQMARDSNQYAIKKIIKAANLVGKEKDLNILTSYLKDSDASVRFWALNAIDAYEGDIAPTRQALLTALEDPSLPNRGLAAELLIKKLEAPKNAFLTLEQSLSNTEDEVMLLHLAVNVRNLDDKALELLPTIKEKVYPKIQGDIWGRYKSWSYPMFIGMALDQTLINCGESY